jgi:hypothetical protein
MVVVAAMFVLSTVAVGCKVVQVGARCSTSEGFGVSGNYTTICQNGRWVRWRTNAQVAQILLQAIQAAQKPDPGQVVRPTTLGEPNVPHTADPSVLVDGGITYVYSTRTNLRLPVRALANPDQTYTEPQIDSIARETMPYHVPWSSDDQVWAPSVAHIGGRYVAFFAASRIGAPDPANPQCIGRAWANSPMGPFVPEGFPVHCGNGGHGALDPEVTRATDGRLFLLAAFGGSNTDIWSIPLDGNGNLAGAPVALLTRNQPWEDWFQENPSMIWDGRNYVLSYSVGHWTSGTYMTGIARCTSPTGPCSSSPVGPWLSSIGDRTGPGGLTFFVGADGAPRVAYHTYAAGMEANTTERATHVRHVFFDPWPRLG